ncbi:hypothetical protein BOTCAL_0155g00160 [Botryotinia calthae]|uniref:C2H2-type domain-containing protein n=1 Tax=Botryotinia calthae TaxID=38488 RepID=A0A4Y8D2M9_9HELO|nr:hypothetical protein BOTCAL_0155g00160 [Botryotinia calthae]
MTDSFQIALTSFKKRLTQGEQLRFQTTTLDEVKTAILNIQDDQSRRKSMMNLSRVKAFIEALEQYSNVVDVFLNTSSLLCFIWGPMKFCLQVASSWAESFDTLLDAYQQLVENIPLLEQYGDLFKGNSYMVNVLALIYEDMLDFHRAALRVFSKSTRHKALVESQATILQFEKQQKDYTKAETSLSTIQESILSIQEYQREHLNHKKQFEAIEKEDNKRQRLALIDWLASTDPIPDHEFAVSMRADCPSSGNWILRENKIEAWLDPQQSTVPLLWINGIPGAGKTILTSVIIGECMKNSSSSTIFFYCRYEDKQRDNFVAVARGILSQLLSKNEVLLPYLYSECINSLSVSLISHEICMKLLEVCFETVSKSQKTYLIIDGLDECEPMQRRLLLSTLVSIVQKALHPGMFRLLIVSQNEPDIKRYLRQYSDLRLSSSCNRSDIEVYSRVWAEKIQQKFIVSDDTKTYIVKAVSEGADGMFLYAKLILTNLYGQTSREKLYEELQPGTFPVGFEQAYSRIVSRVYQNPNQSERATAEKLLGWISCAMRPMRCYLIDKSHVKIVLEEQKLAVMCLRYLLFQCFDPTTPDNQIHHYANEGYYAFQEYAIVYWVDHLESLIEQLSLSDLENSEQCDLGSAIAEFYEIFGIQNTNRSDVPSFLEDRCTHLVGSDQLDSLLLLLSHTRKVRADQDELTEPKELKIILEKVRSYLTKLSKSKNLTIVEKEKLNTYYGSKWIKCPRHACFYFYEGFPDESSRDKHLLRHEKPFLCTDLNCLRKHWGYSTENELKRHVLLEHPNPAAFGGKFPKVKKEPVKHQCDKCESSFTRSSGLKIHQRTHDGIRPFKCESPGCSATFVRKWDRDRHAKSTHSGKGNASGSQSSQSTPTQSLP